VIAIQLLVVLLAASSTWVAFGGGRVPILGWEFEGFSFIRGAIWVAFAVPIMVGLAKLLAFGIAAVITLTMESLWGGLHRSAPQAERSEVAVRLQADADPAEKTGEQGGDDGPAQATHLLAARETIARLNAASLSPVKRRQRREVLGWSIAELAARAGEPVYKVEQFESGGVALYHAVRIGGTLFASDPPTPDLRRRAEIALDQLAWWRLDSQDRIDAMRKEMAALAFSAHMPSSDAASRLDRRLALVDIDRASEVAGAFVDEIETILNGVDVTISDRLANRIESLREKHAAERRG
jgi:hypothetical protein